MSNSNFEKVQKILREAANAHPEAYGGQPLWEFDIEKFLSAKLHGLPLIAPVPVKSCCGTNESTEGNSAGRGEQSNLIKGLRGKTPFDGSQFPPLPWGGNPVSAENIQLISDWIDSGCPVNVKTYEFEIEKPNTETEKKDLVFVFSHEIAGNEYPDESVTNYQYEAGELKQRMNIDCMSESQLENLRCAFRELYNLNKWPLDGRNYNNLALIHQNHCQHGWERFLPWHRIYLYEFEQALQDHCPGVTMPYWDWTMRQYKPEHPEKGWRIPKALQAYLTTKSLEFLSKHDIPTECLKEKGLVYDPSQKCYTTFATQTDFFAAVEKCIGKQYTQGNYRNRFIDALLAANALWYPLRYPGQYKNGGTINRVIHYHYPSAHDMEQIMSLQSFRDFGGGSLYNDSYGFIDQNPHNTMHIWTGGMNPEYEGDKNQNNIAPEAANRNKAVKVAGRKLHKLDDLYSQPEMGDMFSNLTAAYDPVFWPIHANIDRLWWEWQQQHPESVPADLDAVLTPWSYTIRDTLKIERFGYEYVKNTYLFPVGLEVPVGRFVSKMIDVSAIKSSGFTKAEVRLHRVPQLLRSCFIRVFLNLPDANASTPLDNPHYGGYLAVFGHGACYGGPGHCEPAPLRRREYDLRPRDHNTPRNYRLNVTKCAKRLLKPDTTTLQVTLVVIGADYQEDHELLRLKSVSLNFLD
ncbi:putative tyrosinase [Cylindrospermum sp. NIES-4074]|nr:putative tyrosinase [Cylindrospermum sp. NIES-4074]